MSCLGLGGKEGRDCWSLRCPVRSQVLWVWSPSVLCSNILEGLLEDGVPCSLTHCGSAVMNPISIREDVGLIPGPTQWVKDSALLWLWCRPAAVAPIQPLAWEPPYASSIHGILGLHDPYCSWTIVFHLNPAGCPHVALSLFL